MQSSFINTKATAVMHGANDMPSISGTVEFYQKPNCVLVVANIKGLPENTTGFFGFHIHEGTSCGGNGFALSGTHYNPNGVPHPSHAGDLPPLMLCGNKAHLAVLTDRFKVSDIIGRTVIIHGNPDDFTTQPSGNAGTKIACGVIEKR